jgi:peptidyl-prolyl cis-trans isomerase SurA
MIKKVWLLAGILTMAVASPQPALGVRKLVGRVVARINNDVVTNWQFEREEQKLRDQLAQQYSGAELEAQFKAQSKNLLRDLIDQDLMVQKAKDLDINVETDVVKRLDDIRKDMKLETQADLQTAVEKQGLLWEDFEDNIRRHLLMSGVIGREVGSRLIISREDARKYYDAHQDQFNFPEGIQLADIQVSTANRTPEDAEKRAQKALEEIKAGQRWNDVCERYSDDTRTAENGGDLGFFKKGTLAVELAEAIDKIEAGETTGVLKTQYGFMILKVTHRSKEGIAPFVDVEQRIDEILYNQKMQPALREYLTRLRKQSYISLAPGMEDSGAEPGSGVEVAKADQ